MIGSSRRGYPPRALLLLAPDSALLVTPLFVLDLLGREVPVESPLPLPTLGTYLPTAQCVVCLPSFPLSRGTRASSSIRCRAAESPTPRFRVQGTVLP